MNKTYYLSRAACKIAVNSLPDWSITRFVGQELVAPCYHLVSGESPVHTKHLYKPRGIEEFKRELDYLLTHFKPISLTDLSAFTAAGDAILAKSFFLSFDDGFREMSEIVADICRQKGIPATFFLTTAFLDNQTLGFRHKASLLIENCRERYIAIDDPVLKPLVDAVAPACKRAGDLRRMFLSIGYKQAHVLDECAALMEVDFAAYLQMARPYLSREQVAKLIADGFSIGGHSVDHPLYTDLGLHEQVEQTVNCMEELNSQFPPGTRAFAFPFVSDGVEESFFAEMFDRKVIDLAFCIGRMPTSPNARAWQRFGVEAEQSIPIQKLLKTHFESRLRQRLFSRKIRESLIDLRTERIRRTPRFHSCG